LVGIGPGGADDRTLRAEKAIAVSDIVVGYTPYIESIRDLLQNQETFASGMRQEKERCREAIAQAAAGKTVALISSGDAGIYGMAGLAMELIAAEKQSVPVEVIPGVSAANAAAAVLGAPLMCDFAVISLSDLLVPWEKIVKRLEAAAAADLTTALYNPRSKRRVEQLKKAVTTFLEHRDKRTPVGIVTAASTANEKIVLTELQYLLEQEVTMQSVVIIGCSSTKNIGEWMVTQRGYQL